MVQIGLLSDTHVPHRMAVLPPSLIELLSGVDLILHAGDLDDLAVLDELRRVAPTQAVRGNRHLHAPWPNDQRLPLFLDLQIEGQRILLTHGHLSLWRSITEKYWLLLPNHHDFANRRLMGRVARTFPGADVYLFGHSHRALIRRRDGALYVNPGAVCPTRGEVPTVARLTVKREGVEAQILRI